MTTSNQTQTASDETFLRDVIRGLSVDPKEIPSKYLYDENGAGLFEQICELPEYYPTRTEMSILHRHVREIAELIGPDCLVIEFGSGAGEKTRILLDHLQAPYAYVPVDIADEQLWRNAQELQERYPDMRIEPVHGDFTQDLRLPEAVAQAKRRLVFFPGSTLGNFAPDQVRTFLQRTARLCGPGGSLLLGADLKKDPSILHAAYNDAKGVTAAFNLNLLEHINRRLDADFNADQFWHHASYVPDQGRVEMHLVSDRKQTVHIGERSFEFAKGESIRTEYSHKYNLDDLQSLAGECGLRINRSWSDDKQLFAVIHLATIQGV